VVSLDAVGDDGEACLPGFLVPAATQLSGNDVAKSLDERINDIIRDMFISLQLVELFQFCLESLWLVEEGHGHFDQRQGAESKGSELSRVDVIGSLGVEEVLGGGGQVEGGSPDSLSEVRSAMTVSVSPFPLVLDLEDRQCVATVSGSGCYEPDQNNQR